MPDYIRIGPAYGQVNELLRPYVLAAVDASADVARYGAQGFYAPDNWQPVASSIHPATAQATWQLVSGFRDESATGIGPVQVAWGTITAATAMPPSAIIARATITLPYAATGMFVFEVIGGATVAPFPVVPEIVANPSTLGFLQATAGGSVIGSFIPAVGSFANLSISRFYGHQPPGSGIYEAGGIRGDPAVFQNYRYLTIQLRTVGSVASGAVLQIQQMRVANLPVAWASTAGDGASAAIAQASSLVGTMYVSNQRTTFIGRAAFSRLARFPAMASIDAAQPAGQAFEVGSTIVAGQADWGSDLVQKNYAQSLLTPGDPLSFDRIPNRQIKLPYISRGPSAAHIFTHDLNRAIVPGNVVDVVLENGNLINRFDIAGGRVVFTEDVRYSRAGLARGELQIQTSPYARWASAVNASVNSGQFGHPSKALPIYIGGDVPAPGLVTFQFNGAATGASLQTIAEVGFHAAIVPSVATYFPVVMRASTMGNSVASLPNGYRAPGSQINFGVSLTASTAVAQGHINPLESEIFAFRTRAFAVVAPATSATVTLRLSMVSGEAFFTGATNFSGFGYLPGLITLASEMPDLSLVDLGEVRVPRPPLSMATINWTLYAMAGASANATVAIFDSLFFTPIPDSGWLGIIPSQGNGVNAIGMSPTAGARGYSSLDTSGVSVSDAGLNIDAILNSYGGRDSSHLYQGRSPYLQPGINHVVANALGGYALGGASSAPRRVLTLASTGAYLTIQYYPRFFFVQ